MRTSCLFSVCLLALATAGHAQFSIDWFTVDGGGGTSTGAVYSVTGTLGQPDAGAMSGGSFSIADGFWSMVSAVQTPDAPFLNALQTNGVVAVFWKKPATDFVLDQTTALSNAPSATVWSQVLFPYQTNATHISISLPAPPGRKFYRLRRL